jgi:phenylalanyl-tRNA synthetase beta chain
MKISLNTIKKFVDSNVAKSLDSDSLKDKINMQLGGVDEVIDYKPVYEKVIIVKIVSATKHPNADKLQVCFIDDGNVDKSVERNVDGLVQVICGAPNARSGIYAAWIPPNSIVPSTFKDQEPFKLSSREIRGIISNGMLASPKELNISNDHEGILELSNNTLEFFETKVTKATTKLKPGSKLADLLGLDDIIIDIENKMYTHRPDLFGQIGNARELSAIHDSKFVSPDWYQLEENLENDNKTLKSKEAKPSINLSVKNLIPELCPRYMAVTLDNITIEPSPLWMQAALTRLGIKPINNVVDITNWIMALTSQPLHAFDFHKIKKDDNSVEMIIRGSKGKEELPLLIGKTIQPTSKTILVCNQTGPIALGGIMGGSNSEVSKNTTTIVLESANFDMFNIRKTSMHYGLFTDGVTRFSKGQSPLQCQPVLMYAIELFKDICGAKICSNIIDNSNIEKDLKQIAVDTNIVNERLGLKLTTSEIVKILNNVEITTELSNYSIDVVIATVPFWRTDLEIIEDIIEEVGRLYSFNDVPSELPMKQIYLPKSQPMRELKYIIKSRLSKMGASEVQTYNFVNSKLLEDAQQLPNMAYRLKNALSPDLEYYKLSLLPSLLDVVNPNIRAGHDKFAIFEVGKCHVKEHLGEDKLPVEFQRLAFISTRKNSTQNEGSEFYRTKRYLTELLDSLNIKFNLVPVDKKYFKNNIPINTVFDEKNSLHIQLKNSGIYGTIGLIKLSVSSKFKLPLETAAFEVGLEGVLKEDPRIEKKYIPSNPFPSTYRDISITVKTSEDYQNATDKLSKILTSLDSKIKFSINPTSNYYQEDDKKAQKTYTFSLELWHPERTLNSKDLISIS